MWRRRAARSWGGFPSQAQLYEDGVVDSATCPLCGLARGTLKHLYWECEGQQCVEARAKIAPDFQDVIELGRQAQQHPLFWERGLMANPLQGYSWGVGSAEVFAVNDDATLAGSVGTDGSLKNGKFKQLRAGGWAAVTIDANFQGLSGVYGALPLARPTSLAAEIWAILQCLRHIELGALSEVVVDCSGAIKGLLRGRLWATGSGRPQAHLWVLVWNRLEDLDLMPGRDFDVRKVGAHVKKTEKAKLEGNALRLVMLSELADAKAKEGVNGPPAHRVLDATEKGKHVQRVLQFIASFRVAFGAGNTTTLERKERLSRRQLLERRRLASERRVAKLQEERSLFKQHMWQRLEGGLAGFICMQCGRRCRTQQGAVEAGKQPCTALEEKVAAGHILMSAGPILFCAKCGCYTTTNRRGLGKSCQGMPEGNSSQAVGRRRRRKLLLEGRHPISGVLVTDAAYCNVGKCAKEKAGLRLRTR